MLPRDHRAEQREAGRLVNVEVDELAGETRVAVEHRDMIALQAAETAIREIVGKHTMDLVLYEGRAQVTDEAQKLTQEILDRYRTGISISKVTMQNAQPPEQVQAAFDDAVKAGQDRER